MATDPKKRRLFRILRRNVKDPRGAADPKSKAATEVWAAHERVAAALRESGESVQRMSSTLAKQRGAVDAMSDRVRSVATRSGDLSQSFAKAIDGFERLGLVALNAGLEAARLGEEQGRGLTLVGEEVRGLSARGADGLRELSAALAEISSELQQVTQGVDRAREASAEVSQEAARAGGLLADGERAASDMSDRLRNATGTDPETARAVAEVEQHARALVGALARLTGKVPRALVMTTLRPVLEPLFGMFESDADEEPEESR